jgi:integrase
LAFVSLGLYAGLVREEFFGLQWGDIEDDRLTVNRPVTFIKNFQADTDQSLKTKASHRTIPVPSQLADILSTTKHNSLYVIPAADGSMITYSSVIKIMGAGNAHCTRNPSSHAPAHIRDEPLPGRS